MTSPKSQKSSWIEDFDPEITTLFLRIKEIELEPVDYNKSKT